MAVKWNRNVDGMAAALLDLLSLIVSIVSLMAVCKSQLGLQRGSLHGLVRCEQETCSELKKKQKNRDHITLGFMQ